MYENHSKLRSHTSTQSESSLCPDYKMKPWFLNGSHESDYEIGIDDNHDGKRSGFLRSKVDQPRGFGGFMQMFKADRYRNKRMRFAAIVKSEEVVGWAGLWMRMEGAGKEVLGFDNMQNRPILGTKDWQRYQVVLDVPKESVHIAFGVLLSGKGQLWVSDVVFQETEEQVTAVDDQYPDEPGNLDFSHIEFSK